MNGKQLKELREKHGISREELAASLGIARQTIRKYEIYSDDPEQGLPLPENKVQPIKNAIRQMAMGGTNEPGAILDFYLADLKSEIEGLKEEIQAIKEATGIADK
jgi:transcriptional regulator with XRE-family HTH domain